MKQQIKLVVNEVIYSIVFILLGIILSICLFCLEKQTCFKSSKGSTYCINAYNQDGSIRAIYRNVSTFFIPTSDFNRSRNKLEIKTLYLPEHKIWLNGNFIISEEVK